MMKLKVYYVFKYLCILIICTFSHKIYYNMYYYIHILMCFTCVRRTVNLGSGLNSKLRHAGALELFLFDPIASAFTGDMFSGCLLDGHCCGNLKKKTHHQPTNV